MNVKRFVLSYYENATSQFHITKITSPKEALKLHSHSYFQVYCITGGTVLHHLEGKTAKLTKGDVFILPPNREHRIETPAGEVNFTSMSFMPEYFQGTQEGNKLILDFLSYLQADPAKDLEPRITLSYEDAVFTEILLDRILEEFGKDQREKNELIRECVSVLLSLFAREYFREHDDAFVLRENRELVMQSIEYIKNHFEEEMTLTEIVRRSAMSKTVFCTLFRSIVGLSFKEYLNRVRIEKAAEWIAAGEKIAAVSGRCGYGDFSTFYCNFKRYMGLSPSEFRKKNHPR